MQTRLIQYFLALERERHFGRAAAACNVSQPTLSSGISTLEAQLGKRLILRDRRYAGLTPEGMAILPWARQLMAAAEGLYQTADTAQGPLQGEARLGIIPAAMPSVGLLIDAIQSRHETLNVTVLSMTSRQIEKDLVAFELDAGLTYLDFEPPAHSLSVPLYVERYVLVISDAADFESDGRPVAWADVSKLPLCLLHQAMQNRRILDAKLAALDLALRPHVTADSYIALVSMVQQGRLASIIPDSYCAILASIPSIKIVPIAQDEGSRIGLIVSDRPPLSPIAKAILAVAKSIDMGTHRPISDR